MLGTVDFGNLSARGNGPRDRVSQETTMSHTTSGGKNPHGSSIDPQTTVERPWDTDWSNEMRRREEGVDKISEFLLQKRKSRHLARERDIDRQRAANLLKYGDAEVPDAEVL